MSTFVLVHGAWQGASTWDFVVPKLRAAGHQVFTPVLTGLGEDRERLSSAVNLDTHIEDVARALMDANLYRATLVGHSYAGMIITGVAERERDRLSRLIYVDAFIPNDQESALDLLPESARTSFQEQARANGGWRLPCSEKLLDIWGLQRGPARDWVRARLCDFSLHCFEQKLRIPSNAASTLPRTFVAAVADNYPARPIFEPFRERANREHWEYREILACHECHVEAPDAFVSLLLAGASDTR